MIKASRRSFLKNVGYSSIALGGLSVGSAAAAILQSTDSDRHSAKIMSQSLRFVGPDRDITLYLQQPIGEERITLINNSQHPVRLDSKQPLQFKNINGSLVLKLNQAGSSDMVLASGDVVLFDVKTNSNTVSIRSAHPAFRQYFKVAATRNIS